MGQEQFLLQQSGDPQQFQMRLGAQHFDHSWADLSKIKSLIATIEKFHLLAKSLLNSN